MNRRSALACASLLLLTAAGCAGAPDDSEDVGEAQEAQVVCPAGQTVEGIDVSTWQAGVDWDAVKGGDISFAFARAAYGSSKDDYFDANWAGMKSAGLVRGAYQYWLPDKDPIAQADAMLSILGPLESTDLPPVVDVEETGGVGPVELSNRLAEWLEHVEKATGRKPIIYSGKYFWQDNVKSDAFLDYPLWIPNYSLDCPDLANGYWDDWKFFQYTSTGSVPGVAGNVDRNVFNGTLQDLYAFAATGGGDYAAAFVSQSFPYASEGAVKVVAGGEVTVSLTMKNTGSAPWDDGTRLGTTKPRDRESLFAGPEWPGPNRYAQVKGTVMPGETYTFEWTMHAPKDPGLYDEHIGMVQEGVAWFGDPGQGGPADGQLEGRFQVLRPPPNDGSGDPGVKGPGRQSASEDGSDLAGKRGCSAAPAGGAPAGSAFWAAAAVALAGLLRRRRR